VSSGGGAGALQPPPRVRVLHVDAGREWRGGQNQVRLLTSALSRQPALEIRLVTRRGGALARRAAAEGVAVTPVPWDMGLDPRAGWRLFSILREFRPTIVHVHDSHALALARAARRFVRRSRPRLVAHRRVDFHVRPGSGWFRADHVIAVSEAVRRILAADGLPRDRITVILDGIDVEEVRAGAREPFDLRARLGLAAGTPVALNVAALVDHKDQRTLIRAAAAVRTLRPDVHWVIAGDGELRHTLETEIARYQLGDHVHLVGYIPEVDALIREADVFVMSSKEEGLGSVLLHALALERPVVATAAGGIPELLPPECLVPVGDAESLGRRVLAGLARPIAPPFPSQCAMPVVAQRTLALYRSLV
jgi:glycosyltransferase involved in cell wall biosynthesis